MSAELIDALNQIPREQIGAAIFGGALFGVGTFFAIFGGRLWKR